MIIICSQRRQREEREGTMKYEHIKEGRFQARPNRFIAHVEVDGETVICHVKNTGRCRELLIPGVRVWVQYHPDAEILGRKTKYSLIAVEKGEKFINMDSQAPNQIAAEWLADGGLLPAFGVEATEIRREVKFGNSRFDLAFLAGGKPAFMEVKGVTLEEDGVAMFPDAPTERGIKHLQELGQAAGQGFETYVLFVIQMKGVHVFTPNEKTHPEFAQALKMARQQGVRILAYDCLAWPETLCIDQPVPVTL